ncbi:MAG: hypothetical protein ACOYT8_04115 [Candidatus Dependentiae bacterium]
MEFGIIRRLEDGGYFLGPHSSDYLIYLGHIFTDGQSFTKKIIEQLSKTDFRGFAGNITTVRPGTNNDKVQIGDEFWFEYDTEPIEIDKQELLRVAKEGLSLMEKDVAYIVLTREDEKSPIAITDQLPDAMELFEQGYETKARYKGKIYT